MDHIQSTNEIYKLLALKYLKLLMDFLQVFPLKESGNIIQRTFLKQEM